MSSFIHFLPPPPSPKHDLINTGSILGLVEQHLKAYYAFVDLVMTMTPTNYIITCVESI